MRTFRIFLATTMMTFSLYSQEVVIDQLYFTGEYLDGIHRNYQAKVNFSPDGKLGLSLGWSQRTKVPDSRPDDYSPEFFSAGALDKWSSIEVSAGKIYDLNRKRTIRLNLSAGLGYSRFKEPRNWERVYGNPFLANYTHDYREFSAIGAFLNPKMEFPITRHFGFALSTKLSTSQTGTFFEAGGGIIVGLLRRRR